MSTSGAADSGEGVPSLATRLLPLVVGIGLVALGVWLLQGDAIGGVGDWARRSLAPSATNGRATPVRVGSPAPDFALRDLDGNQVRLSDLRGQRVIVNFWATWCPPCRAEMPDLDGIAAEYRDRGVTVLAVDEMESAEVVRRYLGDLKVTLTPLLDADGSVARSYRVNAYPTSFFVGADGVIRDLTIGPMTRGTILAKLEKAR